MIDDTAIEADESVIVTLDSITAGDPSVMLGTMDTATVTIIENEVANEVNIAATSPTASEPMTNGQFTVTLGAEATNDTVIGYSITGTATAGDDYAPLSGEVTISATETSATIDVSVLDDSLDEGPESVIVTLNNINAGDANVVIGTATDATVTINDDDFTLVPVRFEAEAADTISGDYIGGIEGIMGASGGSVLSFVSGATDESGSASFVFDELSGTYDILIGAYDENDGQASFSVNITDFETGMTEEIGSVLLDSDLGSNLGNAQTAVTLGVASNIQLTTGDIITVNAFEEGSEHARFDYLDLTPSTP